MLRAGTMVQLKIERSAPFGYFLSDGQHEILLHQSETVGNVKAGQEVEVFLYHDHQNRLTATMETPKLTLGQVGWLEIRDITPRLGAFLNNGIAKDLLLPQDELPSMRERWPKKGFMLFVKIDHDRQGRMLARLGTEEDIQTVAKPADPNVHHKEVLGRVYNETQLGAFILTEEGYVGLIHRSDMTHPLSLGARVSARVIKVREDGRLNLSMRPSKEVSYSIDAEMIYTHLKERDGRMPYGDHSDAEVIKMKFDMSKSAFKRALGKLMKDGLIEQKDGWTYIKEK